MNLRFFKNVIFFLDHSDSPQNVLTIRAYKSEKLILTKFNEVAAKLEFLFPCLESEPFPISEKFGACWEKLWPWRVCW